MRYTPQPLTADRKQRLRAIIRDAEWRTATSPEYKDAPHAYIRYFDTRRAWKTLDRAIAECGEYRTWKKRYRYKYLILDGYAYWTIWPVLNRAKADTLDSLK